MKFWTFSENQKIRIAGVFAITSQLIALLFYFYPNAHSGFLFVSLAIPLFLTSGYFFLWALLGEKHAHAGGADEANDPHQQES